MRALIRIFLFIALGLAAATYAGRNPKLIEWGSKLPITGGAAILAGIGLLAVTRTKFVKGKLKADLGFAALGAFAVPALAYVQSMASGGIQTKASEYRISLPRERATNDYVSTSREISNSRAIV